MADEEVLPGDEMKEKGSVQRKKIREEIIATENSYADGLSVLNAVYLAACSEMDGKESSYGATEVDVKALKMNIGTLNSLHEAFRADLTVEDVSAPMSKYCRLMSSCYVPYLGGYENALNVMKKLNKKNKKFKKLMDDVDEKLVKVDGKRLLDYLITPVQRLPRYVLLLQELIKYSSENHPQYGEMLTTFDQIKKVAASVNEAKRSLEQKQKLMDILGKLHKVPSDFQLVAPHRSLVSEGQLTVNIESFSGKSQSLKKVKRNLYLFSDILMLTKSDNTYLMHIGVASATVEEAQDNEFSFSVQSNKMYVLFTCETNMERENWVFQLKEAVDRLKKHRQAKRTIGARGNLSLRNHRGSASSTIMDSLKTLKSKKDLNSEIKAEGGAEGAAEAE